MAFVELINNVEGVCIEHLKQLTCR